MYWRSLRIVFSSFQMDFRVKIRIGNDTSSSCCRVMKIDIVIDLEKYTTSVIYDT